MSSSWLGEVAVRVNARLQRFFEAKFVEARATSPQAEALVAAVADLTNRGGKRLRPCAMYAGYCAVHGSPAAERTTDVGAALELLQTYLLIQDDWMDDDHERRGGTSVHVSMTAAHRDAHLGASLAILAADLASGFAWELLSAAPFPTHRLREALAVFAHTHFEVVCGQQLDLLKHEDVARVHDLKSGSYTVRGPLHLGAILGDGRPEQIQALIDFGGPTGVAFQLRDDLLGTFGDPRRTGKPSGNDLRAGKYTSLIAEARQSLSDDAFLPIARALGNNHASDAEVAEAKAAVERSGAREVVEKRLAARVEEAKAALAYAPLAPAGVAMLRELLRRLTARES